MKEVHSKRGRVKCPQCDRDFSRRVYMERHYAKAHASSQEIIRCGTCEKTFNRRDNLKRHIKEVHKDAEGEFECEECVAVFTRKSKLERHMKKKKHYVLGNCHGCNKCHVYPSRSAFLKDADRCGIKRIRYNNYNYKHPYPIWNED